MKRVCVVAALALALLALAAEGADASAMAELDETTPWQENLDYRFGYWGGEEPCPDVGGRIAHNVEDGPIRIDFRLNHNIIDAGFLDESLRAFEKWEAATPAISFKYRGPTSRLTGRSGSGVVVVAFADPPAGALAVTRGTGFNFMFDDDCELVSSFYDALTINMSPTYFTASPPNPTPSFELVLTHEVGHTLGLFHPDFTNTTPTVMRPMDSSTLIELQPVDVYALNQLYRTGDERFVSPPAGAELCDGDQIAWAGPAGGRYRLQLGMTAGASDIANDATGGNERSVGDLPADVPVFASLLHRPDGGSWQLHDQTVFLPCTRPSIDFVSPVGGSELCAGDVVGWSGPDEGRYRLRLGTSPDGVDIANSATGSTELNVPALPADVSVFASLRHRPDGGSWYLHDEAVFVPCTRPEVDFVSPIGGAELCAGDVIGWSGPDEGRYRLRLGTTADGTEIANEATGSTAFTAGELPAEVEIFASLRHRPDGGSWHLHDERTFAACR